MNFFRTAMCARENDGRRTPREPFVVGSTQQLVERGHVVDAALQAELQRVGEGEHAYRVITEDEFNGR